MLKDTTRPISVSPVGVCPELAAANLPEDWFTCGTYTMVTANTADLPTAIRERVPEEHVILVVTDGSLAKSIRDGFAGFVPYRDLHIGPILEIAGFQLPTIIIDGLITSSLECGSLPVVFGDPDGNTFVVRYQFSMDWLYAIQSVEMSS